MKQTNTSRTIEQFKRDEETLLHNLEVQHRVIEEGL